MTCSVCLDATSATCGVRLITAGVVPPEDAENTTGQVIDAIKDCKFEEVIGSLSQVSFTLFVS